MVQQTLPAQFASGISVLPSSASTSYPVNDLRYILRQQQPSYQILTQNQLPIQLQSQALNTISPQFGYGSSGVPANRLATFYQPQIQLSGVDLANNLLPTGGPQTLQIPCVLSLQSPVPISVAPGASQVTVSDTINSQSNIPSSYIDNSTPLVPILRPPTISETINEAGGLGNRKTVYNTVNPSFIYSNLGSSLMNSSPIAAVTTTTSVAEKEQDKARSELNAPLARSQGRQGYPMIVYAVLSPQFLTPASSSQVPVRSSPSVNPNRNQQQQRQQQNRNPFFSVNKRKHFEHYEYF
ncbi:hypothetical protein Ocin01_09543 [Orchesella cincta]|uniref:Uncharacterized protein n=1 Tax=Orchesella cincta TaxID=48709 RepID=A0A1D2MVL9_ORCCI|nr:hypothetical protein Ocin01_09543 [Orchesella cincta]